MDEYYYRGDISLGTSLGPTLIHFLPDYHGQNKHGNLNNKNDSVVCLNTFPRLLILSKSKMNTMEMKIKAMIITRPSEFS